LAISYIQNMLIARQQGAGKKARAIARPDRPSDDDVMEMMSEKQDFNHSDEAKKLKDYRYVWTVLHIFHSALDVFINPEGQDRTAKGMKEKVLVAHVKALKARGIEPAPLFGGTPDYGRYRLECVRAESV